MGIGYSSTYVPSLIGLGQDELGIIFDGLAIAFENSCSPYFRPYMCALYLPPCRDRAVLPCQEFCLTAYNQCEATLRGFLSAEEVENLRGSCTSLPSEGNPDSQCYNGTLLKRYFQERVS